MAESWGLTLSWKKHISWIQTKEARGDDSVKEAGGTL